MKWVEIDGTHINTDNIRSFYWCDDMLEIWWAGISSKACVPDPDKKHYKKLCHCLEMNIYEEVADGVDDQAQAQGRDRAAELPCSGAGGAAVPMREA